MRFNLVLCGKTPVNLRGGAVYSQYKKDKLLYKKRIREEKMDETAHYSNDLHEALLLKSGQDFWKTYTLTLLFMKIFRTASPTVFIECQRNFCFLTVALQIKIRMARFLLRQRTVCT